MSTLIHNYEWPQGADLQISLIYKLGPVGAEVPQNLTGYKVRMDIVSLEGVRLYTFNSDDLADVDPVVPGDQPDNTLEAVLGIDGTILITVPRSLTLPAGELYNDVSAGSLVFNYDIFLRNTLGKQGKILKGKVTVEPSYTLWA